MKLESVLIKRYRSAHEVQLPYVGDFNVFIGKNNSGKSTLLRAIKSFFACLKRGNVISMDAPIGRELIDFSHRKVTEPMEIAATFSMQLAERDALIRDIAIEAPQLKNAVDGLDPSLWLEVLLTINPPPDRFAYTQKLSLVAATRTQSNQAPERVLFRINTISARELADKFRDVRKSATISEDIRKVIRLMDEDDFQGMRRAPDENLQQSRFGYFIRRALGDAPGHSATVLETLLRQSTSFADFQSNANALATKYNDQSAATESAPLKNLVDTFSGQQASVPQYVLNLIKTIGAIPVLYLTEHRKAVGKEEAERLLQLKVERGGDEILSNIKQKVAALLGVKIDAFSAGGGQTTSRNAEMDVDNFLLEVNGSGIKEALRLILDIEFQKPRMLLVEEPEVHLHPALETNLMGYLKKISHECQVFISTHSTNFLDTADMQNVYLVSKLDGSTQVQLLDLEEAEAKIPKELGVRLSSLFMFDRLVFVEGPSDEAIIREWANTLSINLSQANVGFISMGGVRNFGHYAADTIINFLTRRQVTAWFILDRDERDQEEVRKLQQRLGAKARVEILDRREIENFLVVPGPLEAFIRMKQGMSGNKALIQPEREAIVAAIDQCADALKDLAIEKQVVKALCVPIFPRVSSEGGDGIKLNDRITEELRKIHAQLDGIMQNVQQKIDEHARIVEESWQIRKLQVVPGDILLDRVCQKFGVRFKKGVDGPRLASLMSEKDIDGEIKRIIAQLGSPSS
jgi:predicted ATP-dependent endonuclease of OLD family